MPREAVLRRRFWTEATISTTQANYNGNYNYGAGTTGVYRQKAVAVDDWAFPANPFGLLHVHSKVWE
jgi:formylglycine-generating enzyme required for sulfatase activity